MEIYLIRHTKPLIEKGFCYGQSDIDVDFSFIEEAKQIQKLLPGVIGEVHCSPLIRCQKLAAFLFPNTEISYCGDLKEINCGEWELKNWDTINQEELSNWMKDYVNTCFPGGENFVQLYHRVIRCFQNIIHSSKSPVVIIAHAGVMRSILSFVTHTPLDCSFKEFKLEYGTVVRLVRSGDRYHLVPLLRPE